MDVFTFRDRLVAEYQRFTRSFATIRAADIETHVDEKYPSALLRPAPMVQLNPVLVPGGNTGKFVAEGLLRPERERIFRFGKSENGAPAKPRTLHRHQEEGTRLDQRERATSSPRGTG
jgi:hypothetical protein